MRSIACAVVVLLAFVCGSVLAAAPTPTFPTQFSSTLDVFRNSQHRYFISRWFRDEKAGVERFDTSSEYGWDIDIRRYDLGKRYNVFHHGDEVHCIESNLTNTIPKIDFSGFKWIGKSNIRGHPADEFDAPTSNHQFSKYFQDTLSANPDRIVTAGPNDEIIDFNEFDRGTQDRTLFNISIVAPHIVCNKPPAAQVPAHVRMAWLDAPNPQVKVDFYSPPAMLQNNHNSSIKGGCESGQASWYDCNGRGACGGCSSNDMITAHKTLPCGTAVTVTDTQNGKSVHVKVQDRGPFVTGRIVDLNRAPAQQIGMISAGVAPVRACW